MSENRLLDLIERIRNLVTYEEKKVLNPLGLQSIHLKVLRYLSVCNKYSNTPYAISEFLGNTKGTTSQSLKLLQNKGYLTKSKDKKDKRGVHMELTTKGYELLDTVSKKIRLQNTKRSDLESVNTCLENLLLDMQSANGMRSFGVCRTCFFFQKEHNGFRCGLTHEMLEPEQTEKICHEHTEVLA